MQRFDFTTVYTRQLEQSVLSCGTETKYVLPYFGIDKNIRDYIIQNYSLKELLKEEKKSHDAAIQYYIGVCRVEGIDCKSDWKKSYKWFLKSAEQGNALAQNFVGQILLQLYCEKPKKNINNITKVYEWFRKSAEQGASCGQRSLGMCYEWGFRKCVKRNWDEALLWFNKAALGGDPYSQYYLGLSYSVGRCCEQDMEKAFEWLEKSAALGERLAFRELGNCYYWGKGCQKDLSKAIEYFEKAAEHHEVAGGVLAGVCYGLRNAPGDLDKAIKWNERFLNSYEHRLVSENLAVNYYRKALRIQKGEDTGDIKKYRKKAFDIVKKYALKGYWNDCNLLGWMYEEGFVCRKSDAKAFKWYSETAKSEYCTDGMFNLGRCCLYGIGCTKDSAKAVEWFRKSAKGDCSEAKEALKELGETWE